MSLLGGINYISNHGTAQGIITRFFLHFEEMGKFAFLGDNERKAKYLKYEVRLMEDFTNFYDTYYEILDLRAEYIQGIENGMYFSAFPDGRTTSDKTPEIKLRRRIMEFFISGRQLLNKFCKSKLLDDGAFKLSLFLLSKDDVVEKYLKSTQGKFKFKNGYKKIVDIAKDAQNDFKRDFMQLRADLEHSYDTSILPFSIAVNGSTIVIVEPSHNGTNIFKLIDRYYNGTLNLIEDMAAYFYGINACSKSHGQITLFKRMGEVNPAKFKYRYTITLDVGYPDLQRLITPAKR